MTLEFPSFPIYSMAIVAATIGVILFSTVFANVTMSTSSYSNVASSTPNPSALYTNQTKN